MNQLSLNYFVRISIIQIILPDHNIIKLEIKEENITENLSCIWKLEPCVPLVGVHNGDTIMKNSVMVSQKIENKITI